MHPLFSETMIEDLKTELELCLDELVLGGMDKAAAEAALEDLVQRYQNEEGKDPRNAVVIRFPLADGSGKETLFQPVARFLAAATKRGDLLLSRPLPGELGGGFYIRINPVSGVTSH